MTEIEKRAETMAERLKKRASSLTERSQLAEVCILLIDTSGSMEEAVKSGETKMMVVKRSIPFLEARGSWVGYGVVGFGSSAYPVQSLTTSFQNVMIHVDYLQGEGMTNIPQALRLGREMMKDRETEKKRMILLSDGASNCEREKMDGEIQSCVDQQVVVDTLAFGDHADEGLLKSIAERTGGIYQKVDSPLQLQQAYENLNYQVRYLENKNGGGR